MGCGQISLAGFPRGSPYKLTIIQNRLWLNIAAGCPAPAVRFGSRPAPSVGRHLTGQQGLGQPLRTRPWAVFFCGLPSAVCGLRLFCVKKDHPFLSGLCNLPVKGEIRIRIRTEHVFLRPDQHRRLSRWLRRTALPGTERS